MHVTPAMHDIPYRMRLPLKHFSVVALPLAGLILIIAGRAVGLESSTWQFIISTAALTFAVLFMAKWKA
jgi:hypothetical protein